MATIQLAIRDANNNVQLVQAEQNTSGYLTTHQVPEIAGAVVSSTNPIPGQARNGVTITQTIVTVAAATSTTLIAANANRRYLALMNIGTGPANLNFNATATASGWAVATAGAAGAQGGSMTFEGTGVSLDQVTAYSTTGTVFAVLEGV